MQSTLHVLHVTRNAVGLVLRDQDTIRFGLDVAVMARGARLSRRLAIDGSKFVVATRARHLTFGIST